MCWRPQQPCPQAAWFSRGKDAARLADLLGQSSMCAACGRLNISHAWASGLSSSLGLTGEQGLGRNFPRGCGLHCSNAWAPYPRGGPQSGQGKSLQVTSLEVGLQLCAGSRAPAKPLDMAGPWWPPHGAMGARWLSLLNMTNPKESMFHEYLLLAFPWHESHHHLKKSRCLPQSWGCSRGRLLSGGPMVCGPAAPSLGWAPSGY